MSRNLFLEIDVLFLCGISGDYDRVKFLKSISCFLPAGFTLFDLDNEVDITATNISVTCNEAHSAPCKAETAHCYSRADTCIFDSELADEQRAFEVQTTCRNGAHLRRSCGVFPALCPVWRQIYVLE